jgi:L-ascorbate metabolism protein UlaG (beta-lactamase superfamily)
MKLTYYGQSAFRVDIKGASILIDPFLAGNPLWKEGWEGPAEGVTHVLLTHGHGDHVGSTLDILKKTGAMLVANPEVSNYLAGQGADKARINQGNTGGTVDCGGFTTTFVHALHSSSYADGVYMGNPNGLVLHFPEDKTLYHMGDTDIFLDMQLINELHEPKIGLVPIGDRFTMGGAVAALACRRFFKFEAVIPCHYKTFGLLDQTPDKFVEGMKGSGVDVVVPELGKAVEL